MTAVPVTYHVGIVVSEVAAAASQLTELLGITWCKILKGPARLDMQGELVSADLEFVYSLNGPPYLELLALRAGTPFDTLGLNHLGVWTDNPAAESRRFDAAGFGRESVNVNAQGDWTSGLFHKNLDELRLELVDIGASGPKLARYLGGQDYA